MFQQMAAILRELKCKYKCSVQYTTQYDTQYMLYLDEILLDYKRTRQTFVHILLS